MVFTKLLLENALAIRPWNCEAALEPFLPKVARCIPVLPSRYIGKCTARVLKRSGSNFVSPHCWTNNVRQFDPSLSQPAIKFVLKPGLPPVGGGGRGNKHLFDKDARRFQIPPKIGMTQHSNPQKMEQRKIHTPIMPVENSFPR